MNVVCRVKIETHWINGWFLRLFSKPVVVIGCAEYPMRWSRATEIEVYCDRFIQVGAGVRYFGKSQLLGVCKSELPIGRVAESGLISLTFRNGPWNHDPFRLVERV